MFDVDNKIRNLEALREYRQTLFETPKLRHLFLEMTLRCNENCLHCGSRCNEKQIEEIPADAYKRVLDNVKEKIGTKGIMINVTGGEPLLRKELFEITRYATDLGFNWGMTSNATLIDREVAHKLKEAGMKTISISIDGLEKTHDEFRRTPGGYKRAMEGINALIEEGGFQHIQVTTVCTHKSIQELDELYKIFDKMDIDSWRVIGIEPMGRANDNQDLNLTAEDQKYLFEFIRNMRIKGEPVCYGCSHYLGLEYEREVRDWYYFCTAGIYTASIACNGDILACLDIERRPELVQGNVLKDEFVDVWLNKFKDFRRDLCEDNEECKTCSHKDYCHGGSFHSWDFENKKQRMCFKDILF